MKKVFTIICFLLILQSVINAEQFDQKGDFHSNKVVDNWLTNKNNSGFIENMGQMKDGNENAVPFVLFKTEAQGLNFWITETGIVIQTLYLEKKVKPENEKTIRDRHAEEMNGKERSMKLLHWERIDIELEGACIKKSNIVKENLYQGHSNYFFAHCPEGIYDVMEYGKITIKDVYPGIDWVFYRNADGSLKYDFVVHAGANYKQIKLAYYSKKPVVINEFGQLEIYSSYGNIKEEKPVSFYLNQELKTNFIIENQKITQVNGDKCHKTTICFEFPELIDAEMFDSELIIDPQLYWATFKGGNNYQGPMSLDIDQWGNLFVAGYSASSNFPTYNPGGGSYFQGVFGGGTTEAIILKFNNNGGILWSTYYGGTDVDYAESVAIDIFGNVFVTGGTRSGNFPTQNPGGGAYFQGVKGAGPTNAYILKFNNAGVRQWATYYGGGESFGLSITTDASGNVFATGITRTPFPTFDSGTYFQGAVSGGADAFILKFNNAGVRLWATLYGGSGVGDSERGTSIRVDSNGNVYVVGNTNSSNFQTQNPGGGAYFQSTYGGGSYDAFILKFDNVGNRLWSTFYGGSNNDFASSIALDLNGNLFVSGQTKSANLPTLNPGGGAYYDGTLSGTDDVYLLKFNSSMVQQWATYYGGSNYDGTYSQDNIEVDDCGNVYFTFETMSSNISTLNSCDVGFFKSTLTTYDMFITLFTNEGVRLWATYFGGNGTDFRSPIAVDENDNLFIAGEWAGVVDPASYPTVNPGGGAYFNPANSGNEDFVVAKFLSDPCLCNPLPIDLLDFYGINTGDKNIIHWTTMSETNCDYFELERALELNESYTGQLLWETIGQINGAGNSSFKINYEYIDANYPKNLTVVYYRLKQVDFDGSTDYYGPVAINLKNDISLFEVYPNPASDELIVYFKHEYAGKIAISIVNLVGSVVFQKTDIIDKIQSYLILDIGHLAEGVYFVQLSIDGVMAGTKKISITK